MSHTNGYRTGVPLPHEIQIDLTVGVNKPENCTLEETRARHVYDNVFLITESMWCTIGPVTLYAGMAASFNRETTATGTDTVNYKMHVRREDQVQVQQRGRILQWSHTVTIAKGAHRQCGILSLTSCCGAGFSLTLDEISAFLPGSSRQCHQTRKPRSVFVT
jgi:hypothetical protein